MKLVDTHCHINDRDFNNDFDEVVKRIETTLEFAVNVGYDLSSCEASVKFATKYPFLYATVGIHPHDAKTYNTIIEERLAELLLNKKVIAVGEIGLDYYRDLSPRDIQQDVFIRQLKLAAEHNKPVVIHCRDAYGDTLKILKEHKESNGILHSYGGSYEVAKELIDRFYFSISGPVTFKNATHLKETVHKIPMERLLVETDAPYLTPEPHRGKRNEPVYVEYVAREIAKIKGLSYEEVCSITTENAKKAFRIEG